MAIDELRISMNSDPREGPHGGANQFAKTLHARLEERGHEVFRTLVSDLDVILIINSHPELSITSYNLKDISEYVRLNPKTVVINRVNTCDEQRGKDYGNNQAMFQARQHSDFTVFVSEFLKKLFENKGMETGETSCVIRNGAIEEIYNPDGRAEWSSNEKLRVVTHHWSSNFMKGFDIYERLDQLLEYQPYDEMFKFEYIGRTPLGVDFDNTEVSGPFSDKELANKLKQNHIYVTAARNEAGPNHVVEGLQCGLPMLYLNTGALPEYCSPYGVEFDLTNFEEKLLEIHDTYQILNQDVLEASMSSKTTVTQYEDLFIKLVLERRNQDLAEPSVLERGKIKLVKKPYEEIQNIYQLGKKGLEYYKNNR